MKPALHFPRFGKTLLAAALVATFGIASLPAEAKPKQANAAAGKPIKGEINAAKALTFLYGNAKAKSTNTPPTGRTHYANVRNIKPGKNWDATFVERFAGKNGRVYAVHTERYTEQGKEKYIIITEVDVLDEKGESIGGCFACSPLVHGAVFTKEGGQWVPEAQSDNLENIIGSYGSLGVNEFKLIEVGRGKYGLLQEGGGGGRGGCVGSYYSVTMPYGGRLASFRIDSEALINAGALSVCDVRDGFGVEDAEKCKNRKQEPTGGKKSVDVGVVISEINPSEPGEEYALTGAWGGKLMTVDTGAEYYDFVMQFKRREEICGPITWQSHRFHLENGEYKEVGAK